VIRSGNLYSIVIISCSDIHMKSLMIRGSRGTKGLYARNVMGNFSLIKISSEEVSIIFTDVDHLLLMNQSNNKFSIVDFRINAI